MLVVQGEGKKSIHSKHLTSDIESRWQVSGNQNWLVTFEHLYVSGWYMFTSLEVFPHHSHKGR